jgi:hypothetical protein
MNNKNKAKKKHLKELKRKKKAVQVRQKQAMRNDISTGVKTMYHFTSRTFIEGIKRNGLSIGHVIMNEKGLGYNAVNLTEEGHHHDPSHNGYENAEVRIEVKMNTADCVNAKRHAKETNTMHMHEVNDGNVAKHWYYFGQIKTEDFVDVCLWNGKEYKSIELNDIQDSRKSVSWFDKTKESYILRARLFGTIVYDRSGVALEASDFFITSEEDKAIVSLTDAVNNLFKDTHKHTMWTAQLFRFAIANQLGNLTVVSFAIQMLLQHNIEIPTTYLNSDIEKNNQVVRKMSEKLGLGLKECA